MQLSYDIPICIQISIACDLLTDIYYIFLVIDVKSSVTVGIDMFLSVILMRPDSKDPRIDINLSKMSDRCLIDVDPMVFDFLGGNASWDELGGMRSENMVF